MVRTDWDSQSTQPIIPGHSRQDSMDPGNLDLDSGRCSCPTSSTQGMKPLERRRRREHQRCLAHSLVGTPNYIAPEVRRLIRPESCTNPFAPPGATAARVHPAVRLVERGGDPLRDAGWPAALPR